MSAQGNYNPLKFQSSEGGRQFGGASNSRMDSENEDLRGVIDDLTVENKRLKHILRSQHGRRPSPADNGEGQDKLFEVRMHGLPPAKRRELEHLLKNFATSIHTSAPSLSRSTSNSGLSSSSAAGKQIPTDSGYASNSNSAQAQYTGQSGPGLSRKSKDKNVKDYLHDIPDTLMPRQHPIVMSERAKMALVVRRLEQLFTGKTAAPGEHSQPMQQQEVSHIAARADSKNPRARPNEGQREAHILPSDAKVNFDAIDVVPQKRAHAALKTEISDASATEGTNAPPRSPDQRPTRPLDLDIHRAQVAAENIQYIRHLGLSSPRLEHSGEPNETSWLYLNLLINMAQLHTISVTPDFIRKAIKKLSTKLELSKDGHRVRWSGGLAGTVFSKEEEKALEAVENAKASSTEDASDDAGTGGGSKSSKTASASNAVDSNTTSDQNNSGRWTSDDSKLQTSTGITSMQQSYQQAEKPVASTAFDYKPRVYRADKFARPEESYLQDTESSLDNSSGDSSGLVQAISRSSLKEKRGSDAGLLTFYNNPHFCSDCSGDKMPMNLVSDKIPTFGGVLGMPCYNEAEESPVRYGDACYFTPQFGPAPYRPAKNDTLKSFDTAPLSSAGQEETQPLEFSASGLYGVSVEDNFAVDVRVGMVKSHTKDSPAKSKVSFTGTEISPQFKYQILNSHKIQLIPSRLPSPNYVIFTSSSSSGNIDGEDSDEGSDEESTSAEDDDGIPPGLLEIWPENSDDGSIKAGDDDMDISSVDMLAAARATNPEQVAEQERQYMITVPGGGAVAGSLAATVGASHSSSSRHELESNASEDYSDDGMAQN